MAKNNRTRFPRGAVFFFVLIFAGLAGCTGRAAQAGVVGHIPSQIPVLRTPSPSQTPTFTPPPTLSRTPRPSPSLTPSATPLPQPLVIGYSVAGRPLEVYHFGEGPRQRLIVAGIHGGYEWNTIALADALIAHLTENPGWIPEGMTLYILRSANPDGEARSLGPAGRANENGVDINRNFPANWAEDWDRRGCWNRLPITAGTRPGSEPEAGAMMRFVLTHPIEALISYHSAALGIFAGGHPDYAPSINLAQTLAAVSPYHYPPPYDTGCEYTGQFTDWAAMHKIAAVDVELTNHEETDFAINLKILAAFLSWEAGD